jgi:hypothetical protein
MAIQMNRKLTIIAGAFFVLGATSGYFAARAYELSQSTIRAESAARQAEANSAMLRTGAERWAQSLADAKGEVILRSFAAGLAPTVLAGRENSVDVASAGLLRLRGVKGVTVLRADGKVLYASDAKLTVSDAGSAQTRWAMTATELITRDGNQPGITEMSMPITDRGAVLAVVWLSYDSNLARERFRPDPLRREQPLASASRQ